MLVSGKGWGRALFAVQPADLVWSWRSGSDEVRLWCAVYGCTCTRGRVLLEGACVSGIRNTVSGIRNTGPVQVCAIMWYTQYLGIHVLQYPQYCTFVSIHMYPCIHAAPGSASRRCGALQHFAALSAVLLGLAAAGNGLAFNLSNHGHFRRILVTFAEY